MASSEGSEAECTKIVHRHLLVLSVPQSRVTDVLCGFFVVFLRSAPTD